MNEWVVTALLTLALFGTWGALLCLVIADVNREHEARVRAVNALFASIAARRRR